MAAYLISSAEARWVEINGTCAQALRPRQESWWREGLIEHRTVEGVEEFERPRFIGADDHPIGIEAIVQRRTLSQKLGVGCDREMAVGSLVMMLRVGFAEDGFHPVSAADRHGGLVHHDGETAIEMFSDTLGGRSEVREIRATAGQGRGTDGNEDHIGLGD